MMQDVIFIQDFKVWCEGSKEIYPKCALPRRRALR